MHDARTVSRATVITELLRLRPASRSQIVDNTSLSPATVSRTVDQLISDGLVREISSVVSESRGRRAVLLDFVPDYLRVAGIDVGASSTRFVICDLVGNIECELITATPSAVTAPALAHWLAAQLAEAAGHPLSQLHSASVGLPGAVNRHEQTISNAPNLPVIEEPGFVSQLEEAFGIPIDIDNDVNYALLGELRHGAAVDYGTAAMLTLGAGLGAALAIDGSILHGRRGLVGEFGALPIGPHGERLEELVTGPGIMRRALSRGEGITQPSELFRSDCTPGIAAMRAEFDSALVLALTAITVSCESDIVVLGGRIAGSLIADFDRYETEIRANLQFSPKLVHTSLGDLSGAVGAAIAGLQRAYRELGVPDTALATLPAKNAE